MVPVPGKSNAVGGLQSSLSFGGHIPSSPVHLCAPRVPPAADHKGAWSRFPLLSKQPCSSPHIAGSILWSSGDERGPARRPPPSRPAVRRSNEQRTGSATSSCRPRSTRPSVQPTKLTSADLGRLELWDRSRNLMRSSNSIQNLSPYSLIYLVIKIDQSNTRFIISIRSILLTVTAIMFMLWKYVIIWITPICKCSIGKGNLAHSPLFTWTFLPWFP